MDEQLKTSPTEIVPNLDRGRRLALVLWNGNVGGAEILNMTLAEYMRQLGAQVTIVFVADPEPLAARLCKTGVPYTSLGLKRGRDVLRHTRRYAAVTSKVGPDGALLVERGFMGAALRAGGYREPIVAVEHGMLNELPRFSRHRQLLRRIGRISGAWAVDAEVAVSDFMLEQMCRHAHARRVVRIHNGIDPDKYSQMAVPPRNHGDGLVIGFVGRLVQGKGADHLIRALADLRSQLPVKLLIAGDGPERLRLASLAQTLGVGSEIVFLGVVDDPHAFWQRCDIAAVPSAELAESFSMVTLEAMISGKPIVAARSGAIPELVVNGETGTLVLPGNADALAKALLTYAEQPELRQSHGLAARQRAIEHFHIEDCARAYLNLFGELTTHPSTSPAGARPQRTSAINATLES
jgi:glycosyltransferase involved in cell wall biosynthesis